MLRFILASVMVVVFFSCNDSCGDNLEEPLSFNLQWVDVQGKDMYETKKFNPDSLKGYYKGARDNIFVSLEVAKQKYDTTKYFIDMMPLVREAYSLQIDTVYVMPEKTDVDTIILKVINDKNECFSTIYHFERLEYNGKALSGVDSLYTIRK